MKGRIYRNKEHGWIINYIVESENPNAIYTLKTLPLHSTDVEQIEEWSKIFDNIEARILNDPEVEFEIINCIPKDLEPTNGETLSFESIKYARLIHNVFKPGPSKKTLDELFESHNSGEFVPGLDKETLDELFSLHDPEDFIDEDTADWERASLEDYIDEDTDEELYGVSLQDEELLIELESWDHRCGDGCCFTYGVNIYINGEQIEDEDGTNPHQLVKAVLTKLGYTNVKVEYK